MNCFGFSDKNKLLFCHFLLCISYQTRRRSKQAAILMFSHLSSRSNRQDNTFQFCLTKNSLFANGSTVEIFKNACPGQIWHPTLDLFIMHYDDKIARWAPSCGLLQFKFPSIIFIRPRLHTAVVISDEYLP